MGERLMAKLDRLGAEAGIKQMTPEIYRLSMLVRADVVAQWPQRGWVDLTDEDISEIAINNPPMVHEFARAVLAKTKEKNNG